MMRSIAEDRDYLSTLGVHLIEDAARRARRCRRAARRRHQRDACAQFFPASRRSDTDSVQHSENPFHTSRVVRDIRERATRRR